MSYTTTFKKSKCIKCLSDMLVSKSKLHAQNQNGKYSFMKQQKCQSIPKYPKTFSNLNYSTKKYSLKLTRYSVSYGGPTLWNTILDKKRVKLPMPADQVLTLMTYISKASYNTIATLANKI